MCGFTRSTASWSGQVPGLKVVELETRSPSLTQSLPRPTRLRPLSNPRPPHPLRPPRPVPRPRPLSLPIADTWWPGAVCNSGIRFTTSFRWVAVALKSLYSCEWQMMLDFTPLRALSFSPSSKRSTLHFSYLRGALPGISTQMVLVIPQIIPNLEHSIALSGVHLIVVSVVINENTVASHMPVYNVWLHTVNGVLVRSGPRAESG